MTEFQETVRERKMLVPGARRRKRGSKSHKVTLPHDNLSPAQLRKLNGKVETYHMRQPMTWQKFKELPDDLAREYIKGLDTEFHVNYRCLSEMLGVGSDTIRGYLNSKNIPFSPRKGAMTKSDSEAWDGFLGRDIREKEPPVSKTQVIEPNQADNSMRMDGFTLQFSGKLDAQNLVQTLMYMIGADTPCNIKIEVTK